MQIVSATVDVEDAESVKTELISVGVTRIVMALVDVYSQNCTRTLRYRGVKYNAHVVQQMRLEFTVDDGLVNDAVAAIVRVTGFRDPGAGLIVVAPVADSFSVRTGAREMG